MAELPWLPLPPGEARCCFLGTRKLAPTLQIMINMLLNGIIVLSNCEVLTALKEDKQAQNAIAIV